MHTNSDNPGLTNRIIQALRDIQYGSLEIIVHDNKIVRIERHEKIRLDMDPVERTVENVRS